MLSRILLAPAATETQTQTGPSPFGGPPGLLDNWVADVKRLMTPEPEKAAEPPKPAEPEKKAEEPAKAEAKPEPKPEVKAEPKAEPKAEEPKAKEPDKAKTEDEPDPAKPPKDSEGWKTWNERRGKEQKEFRAQIAERDAKLTEAQKRIATLEEASQKTAELPPDLKAKLERLEKENEEYSNRIRELDVREHPKFKAYYDAKVGEAYEILKSTITDEDKFKQVKEVLDMADSPWKQQRLEEVLVELDETQQDDVRATRRDLRRIDAERKAAIKEELARAEANKTKRDSETAAQQQAREKAMNELVSKVFKEAQDPDKGMAVYRTKEGDEEWNKGVAARLEKARSILFGKGITPEDVVRKALQAEAFPVLLESYKADLEEKEAKIATLEEQVKKMTAAQPKGGAGSGTEAPTGGMFTPKAGMTPDQVLREWVRSSRAE